VYNQTTETIITAPVFEEAHDPYGNPLTETVFTAGESGTLYRTFGYRDG